MKVRALIAMLLMLSTAFTGLAEGFEQVYWTSSQDVCYHADESCGNPDYARVAMSAEACEEFGREPCPLCLAQTQTAAALPMSTPEPAEAEEAAPEGVESIERGGIWVFHVPKAALEALNMNETALPEGVDGLVNLFGETLKDALEARVAVPADGSLFMCLRLIDGDAYIVTRPKKDYKSRRPFVWQGVQVVSDIFKPGAFAVEGVSRIWEYVPKKNGSPKKRFSKKYRGSLEIDVYSAMDINIAVLRTGSLRRKKRTGVVTIGDLDSEIPVTGYAEKKGTVFCFVLTDEEVSALKHGDAPAYEARTATGVETADADTTLAPADAVPDLSDDAAGDPLF